MKVRIESDGYAHSTKITDADTGEDLGGKLRIKKLEIIAGEKDPFEVIMTGYSPQLDIIGNAILLCPHCQQNIYDEKK